jgi:hypothetical protein
MDFAYAWQRKTPGRAPPLRLRPDSRQAGGDRLRSGRNNPADDFLRMSPRAGTRSRTHPNRPWLDPQSHPEGRGRSSAQYSFYVPVRTSHPGKAVSRARPESSPTKFTHPLRGRTKPPRRPARPQPPATLTAQGSTTPGPDCWRDQWNVAGHGPSPASHDPSPAHGTPSCARVGTRPKMRCSRCGVWQAPASCRPAN